MLVGPFDVVRNPPRLTDRPHPLPNDQFFAPQEAIAKGQFSAAVADDDAALVQRRSRTRLLKPSWDITRQHMHEFHLPLVDQGINLSHMLGGDTRKDDAHAQAVDPSARLPRVVILILDEERFQAPKEMKSQGECG